MGHVDAEQARDRHEKSTRLESLEETPRFVP
jgi:hypothetical protein